MVHCFLTKLQHLISIQAVILRNRIKAAAKECEDNEDDSEPAADQEPAKKQKDARPTQEEKNSDIVKIQEQLKGLQRDNQTLKKNQVTMMKEVELARQEAEDKKTEEAASLVKEIKQQKVHILFCSSAFHLLSNETLTSIIVS